MLQQLGNTMLNQFNIREVQIFVPLMESQKEVKAVKEILEKIDGILTVDCNRADKLVTIKHNSKESRQSFNDSLINALEKRSFKANEIRVDTEVEPTKVQQNTPYRKYGRK